MLKAKLLTIGMSLLLICIALVMWADTTLFNISQKTTHPKNNLTPYIQAAPTSADSTADSSGLVQLSKQDAATRFGVDQNSLIVEQVIDTTYSDSSLGCPQPGEFYSQIVTPGWEIKLQSGTKTYDYHTNKVDKVIFCQ